MQGNPPQLNIDSPKNNQHSMREFDLADAIEVQSEAEQRFHSQKSEKYVMSLLSFSGAANLGSFDHDPAIYTKPFRLMDLPTELRIMIAEYVTTSDLPLTWKWLSYVEGCPRVGTFDGLEELDVLGRVSPQLRAETTSMVRNNNTFRIQEKCTTAEVPDRLTPRSRARFDASKFFFQHLPLPKSSLPRSLTINTVLPMVFMRFGDLKQLAQSIEAATKEEPGMRVSIMDRNFHRVSKFGIGARSAIEFEAYGSYVKSVLAKPLWGNPRTWKIFPGFAEKDLPFFEYLDKDLVREWYDEGI